MRWILIVVLMITGCASIKEANLAAEREKFEQEIRTRTDKNTGEVVIKSVNVVEIKSAPIEKETIYKVNTRFGPEILRISGGRYNKQFSYDKIAFAEIITPRIAKQVLLWSNPFQKNDNRTFVLISFGSEGTEDLYLAIAHSTVAIFEELFKRNKVEVRRRSRRDQ